MSERARHEDRPSERFPKAFRLKRQRLIRPLFDRNRRDVGTIEHGCIRLLFRIVPRDDVGVDVGVQVGFAPGRAGSATRRNRIKRVLREVYRVRQKALMDLFSDGDRTLTMMILYRRPRNQDEQCIHNDLPAALAALTTRLQ